MEDQKYRSIAQIYLLNKRLLNTVAQFSCEPNKRLGFKSEERKFREIMICLLKSKL